MKSLKVYDRENRNRLLGIHPRWSNDNTHYNFVTNEHPRACYDPQLPPWAQPMPSALFYSVLMERVALFSNDGWDAEVALVTDAPLEHLMKLRDFRLPNESEHAADYRRCGY